jgi:sorbitol/mannitol transport system permease protein
MNRILPRALMAPAVVTLFLWMIVPLAMTLYFSLVRYNLMQPGEKELPRARELRVLRHRPGLRPSVSNTLVLLGSVIAITVVGGIALALLVNEPFPGRGIVRVLLISPFFVMPTANALLWKHMMMNPIYGVLAQVWIFFGATPVDWLTDHPLFSVIVMVAWQWLPVRLPDLHHVAAVARPRPRWRRPAWTAPTRCRSSGS